MTDQIATDDPQTVKSPRITHMGGTIRITDHILDNQSLPATQAQRPPGRNHV